MSSNIHKVIAGRRCLWAPASTAATSSAATRTAEKLPTLLILGGTAQSIRSWELLHVPHFTRAGHDTLVMECMGQGQPPETSPGMYMDMTLKRHVADVHAVLQEALAEDHDDGTIRVDVLGFSFGARVALAFASQHASMVRKLHLTGVDDYRRPHARLILQSWVAMLQKEVNDNPHRDEKPEALVPFAYSILLWTYSEAFLAQQGGEALEYWVELLCQANTVEGLLAILGETAKKEDEDEDDWTATAMAQRVASASSAVETQLCIGSLDKVASVEGATTLARLLLRKTDDDDKEQTGSPPPNLQVFDNCGHAIPLEQAREWRLVVLEFFSGS